jgi:WD40 repeat protein
MYGGLKIWDLKKKECIQTLGEKALPTHRLSISPVGRIFASVSEDNTVRLWDRESYACIAILQIKSDISSISDITSLGAMVCGTYVGEIVFQATSSFPMKPTIITAVRIWLYGQRVGWLIRKKRSNGRWDDYITSLCQWCGQRFPVSDKILDVIRAINRNAGLSPDQSTCLELPDEAWEEPRLLSECPLCHKPLKFNPFIVDNRERY